MPIQRGNQRQVINTPVDQTSTALGGAVNDLTGALTQMSKVIIDANKQAYETKVDLAITKANTELYSEMEKLKLEYSDDLANPVFLKKRKQLYNEIKFKNNNDLPKFAKTNFDNKWKLIEYKSELSSAQWMHKKQNQNTLLNLESTMKEQSSHARQLGRNDDFVSFMAINEIELPSLRENAAKLIGQAKANTMTILKAKDNAEAYFEENVIYHPKSALLKLDDDKIKNFLGAKKIEELKEKAYKAETHRVLNDAVSNPEEALEKILIGEYIFKDEKQKNEALKSIKNIKTNKEVYEEIEKIRSQTFNESEALSRINDTQESFDKRLLWINEQELLGNISQNFAADARRVINSRKELDKIDDSQFMTDIIIQANDLNVIDTNINSKDFLIGIKNLQNKIIKAQANGRITAEDAKKLNNQLRTLSSKNVAEATSYAFLGKREFKSALKMIEQNLSPELRGQATRDLFYLIEGTKNIGDTVSEDQRDYYFKKLAGGVIDKIKNNSREKAQKSIDDISSPKPQANNQKMMIDAKGNKALVEVDSQGKPIRVIKDY